MKSTLFMLPAILSLVGCGETSKQVTYIVEGTGYAEFLFYYNENEEKVEVAGCCSQGLPEKINLPWTIQLTMQDESFHAEVSAGCGSVHVDGKSHNCGPTAARIKVGGEAISQGSSHPIGRGYSAEAECEIGRFGQQTCEDKSGLF